MYSHVLQLHNTLGVTTLHMPTVRWGHPPIALVIKRLHRNYLYHQYHLHQLKNTKHTTMSVPAEHTDEHQDFTQDAIRTQKILTGVSRTLDTAKIKHQGDRATAVHAIIARLRADGVEFRVSDRNWVIPEKNGQPINLQLVVDQILLTDSSIGDPASVQAVVATGDLTVESRSDLTTAAQKVAYINKHGYAAWAALPMQRRGAVNLDPATMTKDDYNRMNVKQKIAFQRTIDERQLGQILSRR